MAGSFVKVEIEKGQIMALLLNGSDKVNRAIAATLQRQAVAAENWMKGNAPWTDRTGNARNGLSAQAVSQGSSHAIDLLHQVPYGLWLEVRFEGRNAIIEPALTEFGPRVMQALNGTMERLR